MKFLANQERQKTQSQRTCSKPQKNILAKDVRLKDIAKVLELSLTCTYRLVAKIGDGKEEDEIFAAKKGRKRREYCDAKTSINGMLLRDSSLTQKEIGNNLKDMNMGRSQSEYHGW